VTLFGQAVHIRLESIWIEARHLSSSYSQPIIDAAVFVHSEKILERHASKWTPEKGSNLLKLRIVLPEIDFDFRADAVELRL